MEENKKSEEELVAFLAGESEVQPTEETLSGKAFADLEQTWDLAGTAFSFRNSDSGKAWDALQQKMDSNTVPTRLRTLNLLRYAAIFVALVAIGSITLLLTRRETKINDTVVASFPAMKIIQTTAHPSELTTVLLSDGSTVRINAGTTLQYPEHFNGSERKVLLSGEAYFEVVHDPSHPFVVETSQAKVEDLGTSFNVSAYPGRNQVVVNVTSGIVRLSNKSLKESSILKAGSHGRLLTEQGRIVASDQLSPNYLSWITRELSFHHTPLSSVCEELENIYHVRIEFSDPKIAQISYSANFDKFQLEEILQVIAKTHHLTVLKQNDQFTLAVK